MELLKSIVVDFVLFSSIEGFIFCLFFEKIGKCRKFKWYEWLLLSIGNCVISQVFPPVIFQIFMITWMTFMLYNIDKRKTLIKYIKYSALSILLFCVYEVIYSIILLYGLNFDALLVGLRLDEKIKLFFTMIPLRIVEIGSIILYNKIQRRI